MTTDTSNRILVYIEKNNQAKVVDLVRTLGITNSAVHRQLNKLIEQGKITKVGKPPVVFYIRAHVSSSLVESVPHDLERYINENYIYVSPSGEFLIGIEGFYRWVTSIHQEQYLLSLAKEYVKVRTEANDFITPGGFINATQAKANVSFTDHVLHTMLYKDFYSIEKFGKTQLGQMVLYAKISQNMKIIEKIVEQIKPAIDHIIKTYHIDTIAYIPPSVKRQVQLMTEMKQRLHIPLPEISLVKAYAGDVIVSQKSLSKLDDRIINAQQTIFVDEKKSIMSPNNVLIIDDAVGSGATIHETAKKIKQQLAPTGHIIAFAIVGSMKGFEVIREI